MLNNLLHQTYTKILGKTKSDYSKWLKMDDNGKIFKGAKEKAIELKTMLIFFPDCFKKNNTRKRKLNLSRSCPVNTICH